MRAGHTGSDASDTRSADDCMYAKGAFKTESIRQVLFNGRHSNITLFVTAQYLMDIDASVRINIDYVVSFRDDTPVNVRKFRDYYCGAYTAQQFEKVFKAATDGHKCLVVDRVKQRVQWYQAPYVVESIPNFTLCSRAIWALWNSDGVRRGGPGDDEDADGAVRLLTD